MSKIYLIVAICAMIVGAYFYGANISDAKCRMRYIQQDKQDLEQTIKTKKEIHEKVLKTGVHDIRDILHTKYTIQE